MTDQQQIGHRLNQIRNELGLTQRELAQAVSLQPGFINNVINGKKGIGHHLVINIAKAYKNLNIRWLLTGEGDMWTYPNYYPPPEIGSGSPDTVQETQQPKLCIEPKDYMPEDVFQLLQDHELRLRNLEKQLPAIAK